MMPITNLRDPLNKVAMPTLSRLQNEPEQYRNYYKKLLSILSFVSIPSVMFMFVCSDRIISLVFGAQWLEASALFKILALAGLIQTVSSTKGLVLLSKGKSRKFLWPGAANALVISTAFILGCHGAQRALRRPIRFPTTFFLSLLWFIPTRIRQSISRIFYGNK